MSDGRIDPVSAPGPMPEGGYVDRPDDVDRLLVRLWPDGTIFVKASGERLREFERRCAEAGLTVRLEQASLCG